MTPAAPDRPRPFTGVRIPPPTGRGVYYNLSRQPPSPGGGVDVAAVGSTDEVSLGRDRWRCRWVRSRWQRCRLSTEGTGDKEQERYLILLIIFARFFQYNAIWLMLNYDKVGGSAAPSASLTPGPCEGLSLAGDRHSLRSSFILEISCPRSSVTPTLS